MVPPEKTRYEPRGTKLPQYIIEMNPENCTFASRNVPVVKGKPNLPISVFSGAEIDPLKLFLLMFNDEIIDRLTRCTNLHAAKEIQKKKSLNPQLKTRAWRPAKTTEIMAYIGIIIYQSIHREPELENYWNPGLKLPTFHLEIMRCMSLERFQQMHRYFHVFDKEKDATLLTNITFSPRQKAPYLPHHKVTLLGRNLSDSYQKFWTCGSHVAVDEAIEGFTGRSSCTVTIPTKPTPTGYKIWVLGDQGYVYSFMWHLPGSNKDRGPQFEVIKEADCLEMTPTARVVVELMNSIKDTSILRCVWLDNLFTCKPLLLELLKRGFHSGGTVRTNGCRTPKEIQADSQQVTSQPTMVENLESIEENTQISTEPSQNPSIFPSSSSEAHSQPTTTENPTKNTAKKPRKKVMSGMHITLQEIKTKWTRELEWGSYYCTSSDDDQILQFAWRDNATALFMSTHGEPGAEILRNRTQPKNAPEYIRKTWQGQYVKELPIPQAIDDYNKYAGGVDQADQLRATYKWSRRAYRTWYPLWNYLRETTLSNCWKLYSEYYGGNKTKYSHKGFTDTIASGLMGMNQRELSKETIEAIMKAMCHQISINSPSNTPSISPRNTQNTPQNTPQKPTECSIAPRFLSPIKKRCKVCQIKQKREPAKHRKAVSEMSGNSLSGSLGTKVPRLRPRFTTYGCSGCNIFTCKDGECFSLHNSI